METSVRAWGATLALVALGACWGCGPETPAGASDGGGEDGGAARDSGVDAALVGDAGGDAAPTIESILATESPSSVLVWVIDVRTDEPTTVRIDVQTPDESAGWTLESGAEAVTDHSFVLAGLRAETGYELMVEARDDAGHGATSTESLTTAALPAELPPIEVITSEPAQMAEGFTLFNVFRWPAGGSAPDDDTGWLLVLDPAGEVVWYAILDHRGDDSQLLPNGNLIYIRGHDEVREIDVTGAVVNRWMATGLLTEAPPADVTAVDVDTFHHEIELLPNGNLLALSTEMREVTTTECPSYTPSSGDSLNVVGDVIVEFDPDDGQVVQTISMFDALDPCRRTDRGFEAGFWNAAYGGVTTQDWTHGNAVFYDADRGVAITSLRHSDWVVAFDYVPGDASLSGDVAWIVGDEGEAGDYAANPSFTPSGTPFDWQYHQHAPMVTSAGTLLLYDNGNLRPGTDFDPADADGDADQPFTRAVEYALDTTSWTIEQVWEWQDPGGPYAPFVGDADELDNGNVLVTNGGLLEPPSDAIRSPDARKVARIVEIARGATDEIVFEVAIRDGAASGFTGYTVYRADRIRGFPR